MESLRCACAICRGIAQWINNFELLDDRAGQSVCDDKLQCIFMFRTNVNEMNVQAIDFGLELRQGVQFRLALSPVVICRPITREVLDRRELHALRTSLPGRSDSISIHIAFMSAANHARQALRN
jgi:hypothetical protein